MSFIEIFLIALSLSMDALAVSITIGMTTKDLKLPKTLIPGMYFGFFQALMPTIGFFAGLYFADKISFLDHWIAFVLLAFIGGKMIKDSVAGPNSKAGEDSSSKEKAAAYSLGFSKMLVLAIATSIDALAVGITFSFFKINILAAALLIGITTFIISTCGVKVGKIFGNKFQSKANLIGGAVLVAIGVKILIEHLFFL
jgi:putative Mn2+ efflux pump MntP